MLIVYMFGNIGHLKENKILAQLSRCNKLFNCGIVFRFFLQCTHFSNQRLTLIKKIKDIDKRIFCKKPPLSFLFGDKKFSITDNN